MRGRKTATTTTTTPARKTVGYARVSTADQAEGGVSLVDQQARIRAYAVAIECGLTDVIVDAGVSAKTLQRDGIELVLAGIKDGTIGRVVVTKLDRLTRSTRDLANLLDLAAKHDVALISIAESLDTTSAAGRMVVNMLGVVAQWERETISERTRDALACKRKSGRAYGVTPFGYRRQDASRTEKHLVEDPAEQAALAHIIAMHANGTGASLRQIGAWLTANGFNPRRSTTWHAASVRSVLTSKIVREAAAAAA